jgi:Mg2+ and Co2+ transporter CorA
MALMAPASEPLNVLGPSLQGIATGGFHSVSAMHENYGKTLDPSTVRSDVFYALSELFSFSCSASNQAMNLIERNIDECTVVSLSNRALALSNLHTSKTHLDAQLQRLHFLRTFVKNRKNRTWPVSSQPEQVKIADEAARDLLEGYDHLVHRVIALSKRCSDSTTSLMNQSMLEESRNAISQARVVGRLTLLAFSFFGMNVREIAGENGPRISVWLWFVVTAPIFVGSLAVCFWSTIESHLRNWSEYLRRNSDKSV